MKDRIKEEKNTIYATPNELRTDEREKYAAFANLKGFDRIAGYEYEKAVLDKFFISRIKNERAGKGTDIPGSILFFGPQGCGKSSFAEAFAEEANARIVPLDIYGHSKFIEFLDEMLKTAKKAEEHYQKGGTNQRTILIIDEFDRVSGKNSPIKKELERFLKTCSDKYHCTVFATTNYPEKIAMDLKSENSAFPFRVALDPPKSEVKAKVLKHYTQTIEGVDYDAAVKAMENKEKALDAFYSNATIEKDIAKPAKTKEEIFENIEKISPPIIRQEIDAYNKAIELLTEGKIII